MPLNQTSGNATADSFGGGAAAVVPNYIEDVFSTYLYTGTNTTQSIVNGIDLSTKGGMCWFKIRNAGTYNHALVDTARGRAYTVGSDITDAQYTSSAGNDLASFNSDGFTVGPIQQFRAYNGSGNTIASWTFRKQPKFFDIQTATTVSSSGTAPSMTIAHNLGSIPGCVMVKRTDSSGGGWYTWHRGLPTVSGTPQTNSYVSLDATNAVQAFSGNVNGTGGWIQATSTHIYLDKWFHTYEPGNYVIYIFAHDAGGFGLTGTDNVISCGSYTCDGSGNFSVNLGWEPQWILYKRTNSATSGGWFVVDNMRGMPATASTTAYVQANTTAAEVANANTQPNATGFSGSFVASAEMIYIAIRRGPMKVPTDATKVFSSIANSASTGTVNTTGFPVDMGIVRWRDGVDNNYTRSRLQGISSTTTEGGSWFSTNSTAAEVSTGGVTRLWDNTGFQTTSGFGGYSTVYWNFRRAPSFFDEVCYRGTGSTTTITHNLGVTPELVITKSRTNGSLGWVVWTNSLTSTNYWIRLDSTMAQTNSPTGYGGTFSASNYTISNTGPYDALNGSGQTYVAYLFATCPGVSKVGSYTGTGTTKQVDCGFAAGARFVLIKRTDSTGDWYVWDSARGIVAGNDPYLLLNSNVAEVTSTDYIDTYSAGFEISSTAPAAINASGGTYIFLAIA